MSLQNNLRHHLPDETVVVRLTDASASAALRNSLVLPKIAPLHVPALNIFYRRRAALEVTIANHSLCISPSWSAVPDAVAPDMSYVEFRIDDALGELTVPRSIIDRLLSPVISTESWRRLDAVQAPIVFELVLASALGAIEAHTGTRIAFTALRSDMVQPRPAGLLCVSFAVQNRELGAWRSQLMLPAEPAMRLANLIQKHARAEPAELDIGVRARLRVAAATLTMRELRGLAAGDVVLVDERCEPNMALLVIAEHLVASTELLPEGGRLVEAPVRACGSRWEWAMADVRETIGENIGDEACIDDIPLRVTFEVGQVELPFGEIRNLAPGSLLPLSRPLEDAVDIVANGRRLGRGTLVSIGDSVGIQIVRLFGHD